MKTDFSSCFSMLCLLLALAAFARLALYQVDLPGLQNDEAQEAGVQAMQILARQQVASFRGATLQVGDRQFPLMVQDYIGAINVYLSLPFVGALGPTALAVRLPAILIGAVVLCLVYRLVAELAAPWAGALAALMLAAQPSFVFWMRQGVYVTSVTLAFGAGMILAGAYWARSGLRRYAFLTGLLAGLAIYGKLVALWLVGGALGVVILLNLPGLVGRLRTGQLKLWPRTPTAGEVGAALAGGFLGLGPLLLYNLQTGGTLTALRENLATTFYGVNNLNYGGNLAARWDQFRAVLAGREHLWYLGGSAGDPLWEWWLFGAVVVLSLQSSVPLVREWYLQSHLPRTQVPWSVCRLLSDVCRLPTEAGWRLVLFFPLTLAFGLLLSPFTVSGIFPTHFAVLVWLPAVIVALAVYHLAAPIAVLGDRSLVPPLPSSPSAVCRYHSRTRGAAVCRWTAGLIGLALVAPILARDLAVDLTYHKFLAASGGLGPHSDAIYRLRDALQELPPGTAVVAMDWGFAPQLRYLSGGGLDPVEAFGYGPPPDADFAARVTPWLEQLGAVFVFHWPQETIFARREAFEALLEERGLEASTVRDVSRRDGAPVFRILRIADGRRQTADRRRQSADGRRQTEDTIPAYHPRTWGTRGTDD